MSLPSQASLRSRKPLTLFQLTIRKASAQGKNKSAALWMLSATLLWTGQDMLARILVQAYPVLEVACVRFLVQAIIVCGFVIWRSPHALRTQRPLLQGLRSLILFCVTALALASVKLMPFVDYTAIMWTAPVLITALSVWILNEKVRLSAWLSVLIGLAGAIIIINPTGINFTFLMLLPLLGAVTSALYQITTRMLQSADSTLTTFFYTAVAGALVGAFCLPFIGAAPSLPGALLMLLLGLTGGASHFCMIRSLSLAPASAMAPLGYTSLIWASLFGIFVFNETPGLQTVCGAALIVVAGLTILSRKPEACCA